MKSAQSYTRLRSCQKTNERCGLATKTIYGIADAENKASIALCKSIGMVHQPWFAFKKARRLMKVYAAFAP
jgi:RimJ/RimL family protein N-acetyltransferase